MLLPTTKAMMISGNYTNDEQLGRCSRKQAEQPGKSGVVASSRHSWPPSTESRIVRVSRVFGGKDRHSKVRTVKGLRDRRVRLSVPTAIQLYDLQDRLGLSQPSKVVDWLIDAAQHEIDKLPPLQFPPHSAQDLVAHLQPSSMTSMLPPFANASSVLDGDKGAIKAGLMGLHNNNSNSVGLVNGAMPLAHSLFFAGGDSAWTNNHNNGSTTVHDQVSSPQTSTVAHHHSPFSSLLSLAPGPQLVFYSPEGGAFAMKEAADDQFPVDNIEHSHGQLSLSSARSFLHSGSQG
ncbi:hypothetical protein EJB05_36843 [Eragrostis curvula]|uniref:TCP domain-containing protein n=1 Tax=Eragrostis curvula TaxID=38414 RepID=A0A5J9UBY0_9POAL|nr:hypothetical protein EJB05_36843 [Eragrostis curvula]